MKIAICDDFIQELNKLKEIIINSGMVSKADVEIFSSPKSLLDKNVFSNFDIIFLDVDMPEMNGIELGQKIYKSNSKTVLIFVTSYPEYAVAGYECEALRYILKPYTEEKILMALTRAIEIVQKQNHSITIKIYNKPFKILIDDIYYLEYCRRHILYHTKNRVIETAGVFSKIYDELKPYGFFQVHQGYIVNMNKIYDFDEYDIILDNGMKVPVSIRKKSEVMLNYAKFLERQ